MRRLLLVFTIMLLLSAPVKAQTSLSIGTMRTELEDAAIRLAVQSTQNLAEFDNIRVSSSGNMARGISFAPEISILTGEADALNGIVAKVAGNMYPRLKLTTSGCEPGEYCNVERDQNFLVLPVAVGFESDRRFGRVNALAEFGLVPIARLGTMASRPVRFGIFAQGGYKFGSDSVATSQDAGGSGDESEEETQSSLLRGRGEIGFNQRLFQFSSDSGSWMSVIGQATGWYDIVSLKPYYRVDVALRIPLGSSENFDLKYERGSGAPNFNEGDQFSANLTITF